MVTGILEVHLVDAKGLRNAEVLSKSDPYVVVKYGGQERKSYVANGAGSAPKWNERLTFNAEYPGSEKELHKLTFRIMDKDHFSYDDFVGEARVYVKDLLAMGVENGIAEMHSQRYRVVLADQSYCGHIRAGITFTPKAEVVIDDRDLGGWKDSF